MNFEQPQPSTTEQPDAKELLRLHNEMQLTLADAYYGFADNGKRVEWAEKNGGAFRALVTRNPTLLEQFKTDPAAALKEAEEALYAPTANHF